MRSIIELAVDVPNRDKPDTGHIKLIVKQPEDFLKMMAAVDKNKFAYQTAAFKVSICKIKLRYNDAKQRKLCMDLVNQARSDREQALRKAGLLK